MNGRLVRIEIMECKCGATARYNVECSVGFVDAHRTLEARCTCKEE
tara:strand:+ start:3827 stop:3964 length:138 start_codon:yes stop_codon:yes gene_type:complete